MEIWGGNRAIESGVSVTGIDAWVFSEPYAGEPTGGDIHYVSMCGGGKIARFAVADVAGHGGAVDELALKLRGLVRKYINTVDQTRFVRSLNREFASLTAAGAFATAVLATYFAPSDHLVLVNAGHPPPLWYRAAERTWHRLEPRIPGCMESLSNLPLGIISPTDFSQFAVPLGRGDLILMYTDSLIEAKSPAGEQLGIDGLQRQIERLDPDDPGSFPRALLSVVDDYRGHKPADDDVTLLLLHHNGSNPPRQSIGEFSKVVGKMLGLLPV